MPTPETPQAPETSQAPLPQGLFEGREFFHAQLLAALLAAQTEGWREIVLCDPDFGDWPLGERAVVDALQSWASSGRRLVLLAQRFDVFQAHHARFVHWRRMWGHIIDCRMCDGPGMPTVPSGLWSPAWFMHRIDIEHARGQCGREPVRRRAMKERIDECLRHSKAGFSASVLGL